MPSLRPQPERPLAASSYVRLEAQLAGAPEETTAQTPEAHAPLVVVVVVPGSQTTGLADSLRRPGEARRLGEAIAQVMRRPLLTDPIPGE
ncbi:MAG: hypothetical protein AAF791_04400 [Bacteroidota bacterium]